MKSYNILLTGASGTIGREVIDQVSRIPQFFLTVFDRKTRSAEKIFNQYRKDINIVYGDLALKENIKKAAKDIDIVIHLAAIIPPLADENTKLAHRVNVEGTRNLLEAIKEDSPQAFFLYASSIAVYGDRIENPFINTSDSIRPSQNDYYAETKIEAEKLVQESGLSWSIFRVAAVMGYRNHKLSGIMFEMPLDTSLEIITPKDAAWAFVAAISRQKKIRNNIFDLGGGEKARTTYRNFLSQAFKIYGLGKLNFPEYAFAQKNYHCGYYADGKKLEDILSFQHDTLDNYFHTLRLCISSGQRFFTRLFSGIAKRTLLNKSLPYKAYKKQDKKLLSRFFSSYA